MNKPYLRPTFKGKKTQTISITEHSLNSTLAMQLTEGAASRRRTSSIIRKPHSQKADYYNDFTVFDGMFNQDLMKNKSKFWKKASFLMFRVVLRN